MFFSMSKDDRFCFQVLADLHACLHRSETAALHLPTVQTSYTESRFVEQTSTENHPDLTSIERGTIA